MKRLLALFLTLAVCLSLFGTMTVANADVAATKKFEDIDDHWAKADIEKMAKKGVINGISDTEFAPDVNISRAEFLALVVRAMGAQSATYANAYADINGSEWYAGTVQAGKNLGLIDTNMTPGNEFKPTEPINREEMTSLIIRAYESKAKVAAKGEDISVFADGGRVQPVGTGDDPLPCPVRYGKCEGKGTADRAAASEQRGHSRHLSPPLSRIQERAAEHQRNGKGL